MRRLGIIALCVVVVTGGGLAMCKLAYPAYTYRYRMTVNVEADGKVYSGSSVIEVKIQTQPNVLANPTILPEVRGEAVFVDLGGGRNVIALLAAGQNGSNLDYPTRVVPQLFRITYGDSDLKKLASLRGNREVPEELLPTFVTFIDINNPKTALVVQPAEFEKMLGSDVHFKGAWIEITSDEVTRTIFQRLPWLSGFRGYSGGQANLDWTKPEKNLTGAMFTSGSAR